MPTRALPAFATRAMLASLLPVAAAQAMATAAPAPRDPPGPVRCTAADGTAVYADRPCDLLDARPAPAGPDTPAETADNGPVARDCARRPDALLEPVREALGLADGNRLAALYDWSGRSSGGAAATLDRLEALATTPGLEVRLAHSAQGSSAPDLAAEAADAPPDRLELAPRAPEPAPAIAAFRLVRRAGCWWLAD